MFFIFSKVLLILLLPLSWIFALLLYSAFAKNSKRKKRALFIALGLLYVFSMPVFLKLFINVWDVNEMPPKNKKYSCAILLGGFTGVDEAGNGYFNASADRFIEAVKLKDEGTVDKILMSGGSGLLLKGKEFSEADFVVPQLQAVNIPPASLLSENKSRNTLENALFSKRILDSAKVKGPYLLVTSAFHMRRSLLIFKKTGFDVVAYPCDFKTSKSDISISDALLPSAETLGFWNLYTKEMAGYVAYWLKPVHLK